VTDPVHDYLAEIGRKGGAAGRGLAKARTSEQAQAAARARWGKRKKRAKRSPNKEITRNRISSIPGEYAEESNARLHGREGSGE
jgi:hypothetical protein